MRSRVQASNSCCIVWLSQDLAIKRGIVCRCLFTPHTAQPSSPTTAALPTKQMEARAAAAGFYDPGTGQAVPRIQIITLAEIFAGRRPVIPNVNPAMFKAAPVETKAQATLF